MDYMMVEYDRSDPSSIEAYAKQLIGKTFRDVIEQDSYSHMMLREETVYGGSVVSDTKRNKGNLGQIIEERFFHYACNSDSREIMQKNLKKRILRLRR